MSNSKEKKDFFDQANILQEKMKKIQEEISKLEVIGISGAGLVKITVNGAHNCRRVELDQSLFENENKYILENLIVAAFNDAARRIVEIQREKIFSVSNINLSCNS